MAALSLAFDILARDKNASKTFKDVGDSAEDAGKKGKGFGSAIAGAAKLAAGALAAAGITSLLSDSIAAASDLNEAGTKVQQIFGKEGAAAVDKFAATGAKALGQTRLEAVNAAATFGTFGKAAGKSGTDLAKFSTGFASLSTDLASFYNTSPEQAVEAIGAALRGEAEPIRQYGVLLDDATLRQEALKLGLIKTTKEALTPQQKVLAAQAAIYSQTKDAQGDFARTSGGLANQQRILTAQMGDLKAQIGQALLPVMTTVVTFLNTNLMPAFDAVRNAVTGNATAAKVLGGIIAGVLVPALTVWGIRSAVSGAMAAAGFVTAQVAAVKSTAIQVASAVRTAAAWAASIGETIALHAMYAASSVSSAAKAAAAWVASTAKMVAQNALAAASSVASAAASAGAWVASSARTVATLVAQGAAFVAQRAIMLAGAAATGIVTAAQWALNAAMSANPITLVVIAIAALIAGLVLAYKNSETFRNIVNAAWGAIRTAIGAVIDWLTTAVPAVFSWIKNAFLKYTPLGIIISHWGQIKAFIGAAIDGVRNAIAWFGQLPGKFAGWFGGVVTTVNAKIAAVVGFVKALPGRIASGLGNIGSTLIDKGADLVNGLIQGIKNMAGKLAGFVKKFIADHIPGPVAEALGIKSPSRVMAAQAKYIPLGMIEGIKSQQRKVDAAMASLVKPSLLPSLDATATVTGRGTVTASTAPGSVAGAVAARLHPEDIAALVRAIASINFELDGVPVTKAVAGRMGTDLAAGGWA